MRLMRIQKAANHYTALAGTVLLGATLLAAISLTSSDHRWIVFLAGVLAAAVLAYVSRTVNSRWIMARRTAQLVATRAKLATEVRRRIQAEDSLARMRTNAGLIEETLPAMLAYIDTQGRIRYHNRAYTHWIGREGESIDGRHVEEVLGDAVYREIEVQLKQAFAGQDVRYERFQTMPDGDVCRLHVQYLPDRSEDGSVRGVFTILTDITHSENSEDTHQKSRTSATPDMHARLLSALANDDFTLYWQEIVPLGAGAARTPFHEVLLRMKEEEDNHLPPGTFLPWAEEFGLLHEIDRWVVRHVVDFAADTAGGKDGAYMVNLSAQTLLDPSFVPIVRARLEARGVAGRALCFEFTETQVLSNPAAYRAFVGSLEGTGCRFAVSGFGRNPLTLRLLSQLGANFLKLDGGIVLSVAQNPPELARVKAMNNASRATGMHIIAECVESEATRAALQRIGIDFAQGFGIAQPSPMGSPDALDAEGRDVADFTKRAVAA